MRETIAAWTEQDWESRLAGKETALLGTLVWDRAFQLPYNIAGRIMLSLLASLPAQIAQVL